MLNEREIESIVEKRLEDLGWDINPTSSLRNVFRQSPKTKEEKKLLARNRPDFVLYADSESNQSSVIIETKKPNSDLEKALKQGIDYAKKLNTPIVIASDGYRMRSWHTKINSPIYLDENEIEDLFSIELAKYYLESNSYNSFSNERVLSKNQLIKLFKKANNILKNEGLSAGIDRFSEFSNLMFIKMLLEDGSDIDGYTWNSFSELNGKRLLAASKTISKSLKTRHGNLFTEIRISNPKRLEQLVSLLSEIKLTSINEDVKGVAFEAFIHSYTNGLKNDLGQYFTPRHLISFMVDMLDPQLGERVYDPFCGTGGMLIQCFKHMSKQVSSEIERKILNTNTFFGTDNTQVAKIAMMNMIMFGDGHSNVLRADSYSRLHETKGQYDVVITNIPFAQETEFVDDYPIQPRGEKNGDSIGIQHCLESLKDSENARAAIICPMGVAYKDELKNEREYITKNFHIEMIVELSPKCFQPYTETQTFILFLKKKSSKELTKYFTVMNDGFSQNSYRIPIDGKNDFDKIYDDNPDDIIEMLKRGKKEYRFKDINFLCKKNEFPLKEFVKNIGRGDSVAPNTNPMYLVNGKEPLIMVDDLAQKGITYDLSDSVTKINKQCVEKLRLNLWPKNTIIIPTTGKGSLKNHRALLSMPSYLIQHVTGIEVDEERIHPYYLFYFFIKFDISKIVYDLGYPAINPRLFNNIPIPRESSKNEKDIINRIEELIYLEREFQDKKDALHESLNTQ